MRPRSRPRSLGRLSASAALACVAATGLSGAGGSGQALIGTGLASTGATYLSSAVSGAASFSTRTACSAGTGYPAAVNALSPTFYYRFGEAAAPAPATVADSSGSARDGIVVAGGPTTSEIFGAGPQIWCDSTGAMGQPTVARAVSAAGTVVWNSLHAGPDIFTLMAWIQVPNGLSTGGRVLGFASANSGLSVDSDRILLLDNSGHVIFGVNPGAALVISSPGVVNDGRAHQLVASLGPAGGRLYVDGVLVASNAGWTVGKAFSGYWRIGWDIADSWLPGTNPTNFGLGGIIDEVAVFEGIQLSPTAVATTYGANHW